MSKNEVKTLVPKLRFPEFQDAGEWDAIELGGKTKKVGSGITPKGGDKNYVANGRPFVRSQNIGWGRLILDDVAYIDEATHSTFPATEIRKNDVLLNITGASIGRSAVADQIIDGGNVNQHVCIIRTKDKELNPFFLNQFLISQIGQKQIDSFQAGGNRQGLNFAQIRSFLIPLPLKIEEQQKIADCLSSVDELITAQAQKVDALKTHKKGLMQQLFPAEGETVPKLRFPEFRDTGEWENKTLDSLLTIGNGKDYKHLTQGDVPVYGSGGYMRSVNEYLYDGESVCIGRKGTINKPMFLTGKFWTVDTLFYTHSFNDCLPKFIFLIFQNINWLKHNEAGGVPSLSKTNINKIEVVVPAPIEQKKIIKCIFSLDEIITTEAEKLDTLKVHKKGLMQQLFPAMDMVEA